MLEVTDKRGVLLLAGALSERKPDLRGVMYGRAFI
jgi:hypothetical protein